MKTLAKIMIIVLMITVATPVSVANGTDSGGTNSSTNTGMHTYGNPSNHPTWGDFLIVAVIFAVIAWFTRHDEPRKTSAADDRVTPDNMTDQRMDKPAVSLEQ